ncbi:MAG TPA: adenylate/guanylate cyclase domain-containing protein, partial [Nonomuraea sp.]|nr:adenylate/guanylate cyclase domain-containing protein [Nonomuraea sp.]
MGCLSCGAENPSTNRYCGGCGAHLAQACPGCSASNPPGNRFCGECGGRLGEAAAPAAAARANARPAAPSPRDYTPKHLAEKILAARSALEGERKQVTVLFADVVGSTELIRDLAAEAAQRLLDGVVQHMMDAVHRYEGTVSRAMGDGLMALFGAPLAHEDHAVRACYAALAMHESVRRYAEEVRREHGLEVEIRVGVNSGEVVVRLISDDLHMDYTAMGQTVHLAARMEQLARASTTRLTAETLELVEGYVQVRSLGAIPVKGLDAPHEVYELLGTGAVRTRLQASAARGLTRFVGRQAELEAMHGALERASAGRGQVVALVGEPGVGKSRLVWELTHSHRIKGWAILESGSVSYGKATSYLPVIDLLKAYCRIEPLDDARAVREKVAGKVLMLDRALEPTLPALLSLLDALPDDPAWEALDPTQRKRQTIDAVRRLLLRESREQPLLVVFEDLHWIDSETQAVLNSLLDSLPTARILLLVNYRPEYTHAWGNRGYYTQLRVDPLGQEGAEELLTALLGDDLSVGALHPLLVERTDGNPFFLEECVRTLVESRALVGERGAYRLVQPLAGLRVPPTVQAILASRIDRLPPEQKRLLQTAAVVG